MQNWASLDLTGQRYGQLTVLRPAEKHCDKTTWLCSREFVAMNGWLKPVIAHGHVKSLWLQAS